MGEKAQGTGRRAQGARSSKEIISQTPYHQTPSSYKPGNIYYSSDVNIESLGQDFCHLFYFSETEPGKRMF